MIVFCFCLIFNRVLNKSKYLNYMNKPGSAPSTSTFTIKAIDQFQGYCRLLLEDVSNNTIVALLSSKCNENNAYQLAINKTLRIDDFIVTTSSKDNKHIGYMISSATIMNSNKELNIDNNSPVNVKTEIVAKTSDIDASKMTESALIQDNIVENPYDLLSSLKVGFKHDWIRVKMKRWCPRAKCIISTVGDESGDVKLVICEPHFSNLRKIQQDNFELELKNTTVKALSVLSDHSTKHNFELFAGHKTQMIISDDQEILYEYTEESMSKSQEKNVSEKSNPGPLLSTAENTEARTKRSLEDSSDIDKLPTEKRLRSSLTIQSLVATTTHDWLPVSIDSHVYKTNCLRLEVKDDTGSITCTLFNPICGPVSEIIEEIAILKLKNTNVKPLQPEFQKQSRTLEIKVNQYSTVVALDSNDKVLYEFPVPSNEKTNDNPVEINNKLDIECQSTSTNNVASTNGSQPLPDKNVNIAQRTITNRKLPKVFTVQSLSLLDSFKNNDVVDVTASLINKSEVETRKKSNGSTLLVRTILIGDTTGQATVTLWNKSATSFEYERGDVLTFKNLTINVFRGQTELSFNSITSSVEAKL